MPFKPGQKRPPNAGRKPGSTNKKFDELNAICEKHGVNVFEGMVILAAEAQGEMRFSRLKELAQYLYSKRRQVEVETGENGFEIIVKKYISG